MNGIILLNLVEEERRQGSNLHGTLYIDRYRYNIHSFQGLYSPSFIKQLPLLLEEALVFYLLFINKGLSEYMKRPNFIMLSQNGGRRWRASREDRHQYLS